MTPKLVTVCEDVLKERLRSPSTYKRIEVTDAEDKILSRDEYLMRMRDDGVSSAEMQANLRSFDDGRDKPTIFRRFISYDASNAYGVPVRGTTECEYLSSRGDESSVSKFSVRVNGKTGTEWIIDSIKSAKSL
ncbi:hypothetical protein G6M16_007230 [Agrobacterium tumefaciens]|nr:hypothetical protein G6M16_007230 [Agrobacterium tumefaciens]